ncbi:hypothetical protein C2E23DRAFT_718176 [Lenzites betulinus]|nr:hypothetical protein C2E23DRAFT_717998 [Lenzites betulinus]KAH9858958.1 hypothetical protein C2E23DRAFT_718176 [Lenzites betulinus]
MQEFCELEILNDITYKRETGTLSSSVQGVSRTDLISSFLRVQRCGYIPPHADAGLQWDGFVRPHAGVPVAETGSDNARKINPVVSHSRVPSEKRARPAASWTVAKKTKAASLDGSDELRLGLRWDSANWSCAYDSLLTVLWNIRVELGPLWLQHLPQENILTRQLASRFHDLPIINSSLDHVRDSLRDSLAMHDASMFPRKGPAMASVTDLASALFECPIPFGTSCITCQRCQYITVRSAALCSNLLWYVLPDHLAPPSIDDAPPSIQAITNRLLTTAYSSRCSACRSNGNIVTNFTRAPGLLIFDVSSAGNVRPDLLLKLNVDGSLQNLSLSGSIYHGGGHFTSRYVNRSGEVWYHDGVSSGQHCVREAAHVNLIDIRSALGRRVTHYIYALKL